MGSFKDYINRNNTTATNKTSSSSSFMEYHNKRQKEREEEEEKRRAERERQKKINEAKTTTNVLPKANSNFSNLEDLQKEYDKLSLTEQAEMAKQINSKTGTEKLALSSNKFNNTPLYSKETIEKENGELANIKYLEDELNPNKIIKHSKAFKDGYQVGDVTKTVASTAGDIGLSAVKGIMGIGENVGDLLSGGMAQVADWVGQDEWADKVRRNIASQKGHISTNLISKGQQKIDDSSVSGNKGDNAIQGVGNVAGTLALQSVGVPWQVTSGASAMGSGLSEAYSEGASDAEAWISAGINAGVEIWSEYLFGGVKLPGTGKTTEVMLDELTDKIKSKAVREITKFGINAVGEGAEEVISGIGSALGKKLTYMSEKELNGIYSSEQALDDFITGTISSAIVGGAQQISAPKINNQKTQTLQNNIDTNIENTQGQINSELNEILNNKELPMQGYKYESSNNAKINNLRQQAGQYFNNSQEAHKFVDMLEKIIVDKDIEIRLDANLKTADGRVANGSYSNGVITINPNSARTGEFIAIHELTHAIGTKSMMNIVENYRKSNAEFNSAVESLLQNYNATELTEEALSDVSAQLFGNQEFINNIANTNPGFFKKIYNEIKYLWHQFRGYKNQNQFVEDLYYKWTQAYNINNKLNNTTNHLIETNSKGYKYVKADRQVISGNNPLVWEQQVEDYINETIRKGKDVQVFTDDGYILSITEDTAGKAKFRNEVIDKNGNKRRLNNKEFMAKLRAETHIDELGETSIHKQGPVPDTKDHSFAKDGFTYRTAYFEDIDGQYYKITMSVGKNGDINTIYNIGKMQNAQKNRRSSISELKGSSGKTTSDRISSINSIASSNENVNTTKYSMQESENDTELSEEAKKQLHRYVYMDTKQLNKAFSEVVDNKENMLMEYNALQKEYKEFQNTEEFKHALNDFVSSETPKQETTEIMNKANKYAEKLRYYNNAYEEYKAKQDAINSLLMGNATDTRSTQQIVKEAEKHFGITNNFKETAYIDINGNQIDFSGKHEGGPSGARTLDHRQINEIDIDMDSFIDIGNIRILPEGGGINLKIEPNAKQYNKLREYIDSVDGEIYIDIDKTKSTYDSAEYKKGTPTSKIINDLQYYFKNGKFPAKSEFADFRYSQNNKSWQQHLDKNFKATGTRTNMKGIGINVAPTAKNNVAPSMGNNTVETADNEGSFTKQQNEAKEQEKIAQILDEPITKQKEKSRIWAIAKANIIDKGIVFEELSRKANNRELQGKWDYILTAEARGQNAIGQARYGMDAKTRTEKQISKSLEEIRDEVGNKTHDFQQYMYHQLNIDRMTLEERFSGDTGINYERKGSIKNKPVFSKSITADISKKIVAEYEQKNPEFKKWAKDVYDFLDANKKELVDRGVISQELSDKLAELYPHYVPIKRIDAKGLAIKVPLDTNRTGINSPLAKATGGSSDIQPLFQTIADRTMQTYRASARNNFGVELMNTLNSITETSNADIDTIIEEIGETDTELLKEGKNGNNPTFTVFKNGEKITFEITKDMYDALKPQSEWIKNLNNSKLSKGLNKVSNFRRGVLTEYNPVFFITNPIKDFQDIVFNSQHPAKTYAKIPEAYAQIMQKGYWYNEYIQNGGEQNSYFKDGEFTSDKKTSKLKKAITIPLENISKINNVMEMAPRLAEYIASREAGTSIETSMLDASRVTTNFKAGGDITKTLNRNGVTFLNASVQGMQQQIRNIQEANAKGLKGYANLAIKYAIAGLPVVLLNGLIWKDDEDYEQLQDYAKDNYYIIGKYGDGKFIRIPKGRASATIQKIVSNATEYVTDDKELNIDNVAKDFWENLNFAIDNLAPNNPLDNNVLSPIIQTITNTSWYGEDIVPSRLQDKPKAEQYDETTDSLSIWLGEKLNQSPYKINYLLDQYGGGISDIVLPRFTKQAENNVFADKFTTDATMKSKYPGEFYTKLDELKVIANSDKATDEDIIKYKYASTISSEISELYNEKREIQNSSLSDNTKKEKLKLVQEKINKITKESLNNISSLKISGNTVTIGDIQFYKDGTAQWNKVSKEEQQKNKNISLKTYADYKNKTENMKKDNEKINVIVNGNYTNKEKIALYENYILSGTDKKYSIIKETGIDINEYLKYKSQVFSADKEDDGTVDGKTVSGSKKGKVWTYIENMDISYTQKLLLYGLEYTPSDSQQKQILNYVKNLPNKTNKEKLEILSQFKGFTIYKDGTVEY